MPFTPLHMGPGMVVKAALQRHFSIVVFGLTQIAIDLEVLWHLARHEYPLHTFCHTYLGATIIAALLTVLGKPLSQLIKSAWNRVATNCHKTDLTVSVQTTWVASFTGASIGAYSHILLNSIYHGDICPLQPWSASNQLYQMVSPDSVDVTCVLLGIIGLAWFIARQRIRKKAG